MKSNQIELMQHALGVSSLQREPYRNYFLTDTGGRDDAQWRELVSAGYASSEPALPGFCGDVVYRVTDKGRELAISSLPTPVKESEYGKYLNADTGHSFSDWLGINQPILEYRRELGRWQYRMYRNGHSYREIEGDWCDTKKAAKASYKQSLKAFRARQHTQGERG